MSARPAPDSPARRLYQAALPAAAVAGMLAVPAATYAQRAATVVVRSGDAAAGVEGATYAGFRAPTLTIGGRIGFRGFLNGPAVGFSDDTGLWVGTPDAWQLIAREGDAAPGAGGALYSSLDTPVINRDGRVAFGSRLSSSSGNSNEEGIWVGNPGAVSLAVRTGDVAPGSGGARYFFLVSPQLNDAGQLAFGGGFTGAGANNTNNRGLWLGTPESPNLVVLTGDTAPGTGDAVYAIVSGTALNNTGRIAFSGTTTGTGVNSGLDWGLWTGPPDALTLAAREGDTAPGTGGATYSSFGNLALNDAGQIAFDGSLRGSGVNGTNRTGIWTGITDAVTLVARTGGTSPGSDGAAYRRFGPVAINRGGRIAFRGDFESDLGEFFDDTGIYAQDAYGQLVQVAREGQSLDGRTVFEVDLGTDGYVGDAALGTAATAYVAGFTDGSQAILRAEMNDVVVDPSLSSNSFTIADPAGDYVTAGDVRVARTAASSMTITGGADAVARDMLVGRTGRPAR